MAHYRCDVVCADVIGIRVCFFTIDQDSIAAQICICSGINLVEVQKELHEQYC